MKNISVYAIMILSMIIATMILSNIVISNASVINPDPEVVTDDIIMPEVNYFNDGGFEQDWLWWKGGSTTFNTIDKLQGNRSLEITPTGNWGGDAGIGAGDSPVFANVPALEDGQLYKLTVYFKILNPNNVGNGLNDQLLCGIYGTTSAALQVRVCTDIYGSYGSQWLKVVKYADKDMMPNLQNGYFMISGTKTGSPIRVLFDAFSLEIVDEFDEDINTIEKTPTPIPTVNITRTPEQTVEPKPIPTSTTTPVTSDYQYNIKSDGTLEITKYTGTASILEVPSSIDGYMVSQIGARAFANNDLMESLILPDTIKTIGSNAFESCRKLVSVSLGSGVETIKERAFYNCPALSLIAIPESVKNIGENAFGYDSSNKLVFGFSIIGFSGTTAEKYASENGVSFNNLGAGDKPSTQKKVTLKFTKKSAKIKRGKKVTLKVKLTGAKKATFSVDKKGKKVVKLSKKKAKSVVVTGKKKGKAVITAKAAGKTAKCKVTVK